MEDPAGGCLQGRAEDPAGDCLLEKAEDPVECLLLEKAGRFAEQYQRRGTDPHTLRSEENGRTYHRLPSPVPHRTRYSGAHFSF